MVASFGRLLHSGWRLFAGFTSEGDNQFEVVQLTQCWAPRSRFWNRFGPDLRLGKAAISHRVFNRGAMVEPENELSRLVDELNRSATTGVKSGDNRRQVRRKEVH